MFHKCFFNGIVPIINVILCYEGFAMKILRGLRMWSGVPVKSWRRQDSNITMMATTRATTSTITIKTGRYNIYVHNIIFLRYLVWYCIFRYYLIIVILFAASNSSDRISQQMMTAWGRGKERITKMKKRIVKRQRRF